MKTALSVRSFMRRRTLPKLFFSILLVSACYLLLAVFPAHAQEPSTKTEYNTYTSSNTLNTNPDVPINTHTAIQVLFMEILSAGVCQLGGFDPMTPDQKCLGVDPKTGKIGFVENGGGFLAVTGSLIDYTLTPPITSRQYFAYVGENFGIVKNTYAQEPPNSPCASSANSPQGVGFCGLEPVLDLWIAMRNVVYLILILVFVVIGLGIMLRIHIDPRTVMTIQNQIPKIIIGIVAITFSFAIAGLLIDVMWVAIYLFAGVLTSASGIGVDTMIEVVSAGNPFDAANAFDFEGQITNNGLLGISEATARAFGGIVQGAIEGQEDKGPIFDAIGGGVSIIAFLVILIAIIIALLRLWITLILTYLNIILDVIFAPFWILAGLLPGSSLGVGAWIRDLIANLAVFPVAISFFLLANIIITEFNKDSAQGIINTFNPPLMGGANSAAISALIGFGFILMLPNVVTTVKAALKAPKLNLGNVMGPVQAGIGGVAGLPKRGFGMMERYQYNRAGNVGRWRSLVANPLLRVPAAPMKGSEGTGGGGGGGKPEQH